MRNPQPVDDVVQEALFEDELIVVCRPGHPLLEQEDAGPELLASFPWVVNIEGTPARAMFDKVFVDGTRPTSLVETGSMLLMRELLMVSDHLGFISKVQIRSDLRVGTVVRLKGQLPDTSRPIGLTFRADWMPSKAQKEFLDEVRAATTALSH